MRIVKKNGVTSNIVVGLLTLKLNSATKLLNYSEVVAHLKTSKHFIIFILLH